MIQTEEQMLDDKFPAKDFKKSLYNIFKEELGDLQPFEDATRHVQTMLVLGQIAQKAKDNYVQTNVLKRLDVKLGEGVQFAYDLAKGTVMVYEPRATITICSQCKVEKAEYKFEDKAYCPVCIDVLKKEQAEAKAEKPEAKVEKKEVNESKKKS